MDRFLVLKRPRVDTQSKPPESERDSAHNRPREAEAEGVTVTDQEEDQEKPWEDGDEEEGAVMPGPAAAAAATLNTHHESAAHKFAMETWREFKQKQTSGSKIANMIDKGHSALVMENRKYMQAVVESLRYTACQGIAQRGHSEGGDSSNRVVHDLFMKIQKELEPTAQCVELKKLSDTRWACQYNAIWAVKKTLPAILATLRDIIGLSNLHRRTEARALSAIIDETFVVHLIIFEDVFRTTKFMSDQLQSATFDLEAADDLAQYVTIAISEKRTEDKWREIRNEAESLCVNAGIAPQTQRERRRAQTSRHLEGFVVEAPLERARLDTDDLRTHSFYPVIDSMPHFYVVEFTAERIADAVTIDIIPACWLIDEDKEECWYPRKNASSKVAKAMQPKTDGTWHRCPVKIMRSADTYSDARRKLSDAERKADLTTDGETPSKRKRKYVYL
ncbi:hypothetical protein NHX12_030456 [Muraenolepis orangiensis]|uniref:Uncharacterized protein n=1 Tax=Muraenolepis orangiensis TaxID=630683 RepID=A0A9Q0E7S1_9TELE|nr:hypothetical protein NHX12_030456 [Muraenolepis orangiensis]